MERYIPARNSLYDPEYPIDSDDEEEPLGGWNPKNPPIQPEQELRGEPNPVPTFSEADLYSTVPDPQGSSAADIFKFSMLGKQNKYIKQKQALLEAIRNSPPNQTTRKLKELFYSVLALEEELMDLLPGCEEYFGCLQLEKGLSSAVLVAGYDLPFPICPSPERVEEFYEDVSSPSGEKPPVLDSIRPVRPYTPADLNPTVLDPSCDPKWPLANLWPVYVDNFRLNTLNVARRNEQIRNYFAAKGLLATRIFIHDDPRNPHYLSYQKRFMLLDMLVYFTSREDAQRAIQLCHRESYYGHYLNVFPAREPLYYDPERSGYCMLGYKPTSKLTNHPHFSPATYLERNILEALPQDVSCVSRRHDYNAVHFEFVQRDRLEAIIPRLKEEIHRKSDFMKVPRRKQRYLESEMKVQIMEKLLADAFFGNEQLRPELLEAFFAGRVPSELINWNWYGWPNLRKPGMHLKLYARMKEFHQRITVVLQVWLNMLGIQ